MKQKDVLLIGIIVLVSAIFSYVLSGFLFGGSKNHNVEVEVVDAISTDFPQPSEDYFNSKAFDPTKIITIGQNDNTDPFSEQR